MSLKWVTSIVAVIYCLYVLVNAASLKVNFDFSYYTIPIVYSVVTTEISFYIALEGEHVPMVISIIPSIVSTIATLCEQQLTAAIIILCHHILLMLEEIFVSGVSKAMFVHLGRCFGTECPDDHCLVYV